MRRIRLRADNVAILAASFALTSVLASCDPCAGVVGCATSPRVAIQGQLVDVNDGHAISGARVSLVRTDVSPHDSASTTTDEQGNYQVELGSGTGTFDVGVAPPGLASYRVHDLKLTSSTRSGEGHVLGVWVNQPIFSVALELIYRSTGEPVRSGSVSFRRTGGVAFGAGAPAGGVFTSPIDPGGRVAFLDGVRAGGTEDLIGELSIALPDSLGTSIIPDVHVAPSYSFRPRGVLRMAVGPELAWVFSIYNRATVGAVPGTIVSFRRTGGAPASPESFSSQTDAAGQVRVPLTATRTGTVVGDLTITPPAPFHSYVKTGFELPTFDADGVRYFAPLGVGPHLPWLGVVQCNGKPLKGTNVAMVRVGGIAATPNTETAVSDESGNFRLNFIPANYGDLIVDLEFTPPAGSGCIGYVQHSLHLPTLDFDTGGRFIAAWDLPKR